MDRGQKQEKAEKSCEQDTERKSHNLQTVIFQSPFSQKYFLYGKLTAPRHNSFGSLSKSTEHDLQKALDLIIKKLLLFLLGMTMHDGSIRIHEVLISDT